ncbi:hypothetical protein RND81_14G050300 [Saponaria officinalis]|uniref:Uncharacterized protein n=1 Tax=Saponaria officinalis TaxID=3572 RepID=A0AAW1GQG9_SAPOF
MEMEVSMLDYCQDFFLIQCQQPVFVTRCRTHMEASVRAFPNDWEGHVTEFVLRYAVKRIVGPFLFVQGALMFMLFSILQRSSRLQIALGECFAFFLFRIHSNVSTKSLVFVSSFPSP